MSANKPLAEYREAFVERRRAGWTNVRIAREFGVSEASVRRIVAEPARTLQPHGTPAAYCRERRAGLRPCLACCDAWAAYMRDRRAS